MVAVAEEKLLHYWRTACWIKAESNEVTYRVCQENINHLQTITTDLHGKFGVLVERLRSGNRWCCAPMWVFSRTEMEMLGSGP